MCYYFILYDLHHNTNYKNLLCLYHIFQTLRDRAGVARWAHNPKVSGSNPLPATKKIEKSKF